MKKLLTKEDYSYRYAFERGGAELADKYIAYQNGGIEKENELFKKVATHKVMGEFFDLLNEKTGLTCTYLFKTGFRTRENHDYIEYESADNLAETNNVIALAWRNFQVTNFCDGCVCSREYGKEGAKRNYSYFEPDDIDYDKPMTVSFNIDIEYSYESIEGGRNGAKIGYATYDGEKWTIELNKDSDRYNHRY